MPDAVWVATACLHRECGMHKTFSETDISVKVIGLKISRSVDPHYIDSNIYSYCVANHCKVSTHTHRKLYRVGKKGQRRYRLYRSDYPYDLTRKGGPVEPNRSDLPPEYQHYIEWYHDKYCRDAYAELEPSGTVDVAGMKGDPPPKTTEAVTRFVRDAAGARRLKDMYKDECQVCGHLIQITPDRRYSEVHHLRPLAMGGGDGPANMLVLCPTHHVEFDYAVIGVSRDGCGVVDRAGKTLHNLASMPPHRLSPENIGFQLERMGLL